MFIAVEWLEGPYKNVRIIFSDLKRPSCMLGHTDITRGTIGETYLASERELEEEVENRIRYT